MIKKVAKRAIFTTFAIGFGQTIYRLFNPRWYTESLPYTIAQIALGLAIGYVICFLVLLIFEWLKK